MKSKGFTLLELLFVVSIIGMLLVVAYPNYLNFVRESYRVLAQNDMLTISYKLEKVRTKQFSYEVAFEDGLLKNNIYKNYSPNIDDKRYDFTYEVEANKYKIIATPTVGQGTTSGKLYISFDGKKYDKKWDKNNDDTYTEKW
jgi:type IV pilus assembly protein PilE